MMVQFLLAILIVGGLAALLYWLFVVTEGVFLGRQVVVWLYDLTAHNYDRIKEFDDEAERAFVVRPLRYRLRHLAAPLVLDVATGTGRLPNYLLGEPTFNGHVIGLDASAKMLALAAGKLASHGYRSALVQQVAAALPFSKAQFDAVTCLESLEFFPSDMAALREMVRVLRPDGVLMVTRRRGWEARTFLGRHRSREQFEESLRALGLIDVTTLPWQIDYDQVFGRKPSS